MALQPADLRPETLNTIRPAVRALKPYLVGLIPDLRVKLNQNESPYGLPDDLKRELLESFMDVEVNRYPTEHPYDLIDALAAKHGIDPKGLLLGNGSNEVMYTFGYTLISPGTKVVLPAPMFSLWSKIAALFEADLTTVPCRPDFSFDAEALLEAVRREQPALTVLTTPNNPTGLAMSIDEIEPIVAASPGIVVVDEAYVEFRREESALSLLERYPNVISLRTFSKAYGLAGLRLGYMIGHPEIIQELMKARLPFQIDRFAEHIGLALLDRPGLISERIATMQANTATLTSALGAMSGVEVIPSQTSFVLFKTPHPADTILKRLASAGVLIRNMGGYPELRGYLRVNTGTDAENKVFLDTLEAAL
ncbi:MAG: histidinol-phosphate transaminase [Rhodothermales bacterium]